MKKFTSGAPFYSTAQYEKFINDVMRSVFKYTGDQYNKNNFNQIKQAVDFAGLAFIAFPDFGGNYRDMDEKYRSDYLKVLKKYFEPVWLAPFDKNFSRARVKKIEEFIVQAIEQAGLDSESVAKDNKTGIIMVATALLQILRNIQALNSEGEFVRFLSSLGGRVTWRGVKPEDIDALYSEILRNVRINLWKGHPDNEYTYYR